MPSVPPSLKPILPLVQRAQECQRSQPVVAYYCRTYAIQRALEIRDKNDPQTTEFLKTLMVQLEGEKQKLEGQLGSEGQLIVEGFALQIFQKADDDDRAGLATKNTAKAFYAASIFMEALNVFGELEEHIIEKQRYAKWKAADILKAFRMGVQPTPGPPSDDSEGITDPATSTANNVAMNNNPSDLTTTTTTTTPGDHLPPPPPPVTTAADPSARPPPAAPSAPPPAPNQSLYGSLGIDTPSADAPPAPHPSAPPAPAPVPQVPASTPTPTPTPQPPQPAATAPLYNYAHVGSYNPSPKDIQQAQKYAKWAVSSMQYDDVPTAVKNLTDALKLLTGQ